MGVGAHVYVNGEYETCIAKFENQEEVEMLVNDLRNLMKQGFKHKCCEWIGEVDCEKVKEFFETEFKDYLEDDDDVYGYIEEQLGYWQWEVEAIEELYEVCMENKGANIKVVIEDYDCENSDENCGDY